MSYKLVTLTGPSCCGKTTLLEEMCKTPYFCKVPSFTSRPPRAGEENGVDYYFMTDDQCEDIIASGRAQEYTMFKEHYYGRTKLQLAKAISSDKIPVLILEPEGLKSIRGQYKGEVFSAYINAPLPDLLFRFLRRFNEESLAVETYELQYHSERLHGLIQEHTDWPFSCGYEKMINFFTYEDTDAIIQSLITEIIGSDKG